MKQILKEKIPSSIGPYQVIRKIGEGGMGEVFLVKNKEGSLFALKQLTSRKFSLPKKELFLKEALLTKELSHPHILPIYDVEQKKGLLYYTMPFIEGESLKEILLRGFSECQKGNFHASFFSLHTLLPLFLQVCKAVGYAHSKKVLHRDIKPSNILIKKKKAFLLDWGLITPIEEQTPSTAGSLIYLAPEILEGKPFSFQTDVYALGLILYQILTLRYPFHRETLERFLETVRKETLLSPTKVFKERNIPSFLSEIALKCLERDPLKRYLTVKDLIVDLEPCIQTLSPPLKTKKKASKKTLLKKVKTSLPKEKLLKNFVVASKKEKLSFYTSALKITCFLDLSEISSKAASLLHSIKEAEEPFFFIDEKRLHTWGPLFQQYALGVHLSFLLKKPLFLSAFFDKLVQHEPFSLSISSQILFSLIHLGFYEIALEKIALVSQLFLDIQAASFFSWIKEVIFFYKNEKEPLSLTFKEELPENLDYHLLLPVFFLLDLALQRKNTSFILETVDFLIQNHEMDKENLQKLDEYLVFAALLEKKADLAEKVLKFYFPLTKGSFMDLLQTKPLFPSKKPLPSLLIKK